MVLGAWLACSGGGDGTDASGGAELCGNGVDDDGNGLTDCADTVCSEDCAEQCGNQMDDDADGAIDCVDSDCDGSCTETCTDARDNDGDGAIDCADNDCDGDCPEDCIDGRDNDLDGEVDCADGDCDGSCDELCDDDHDNDGDGATDCGDGDCASLCDADGDGAIALSRGGDDCNDGDGAVHPGAIEVCNTIDDDCDDLVDDADPDVDLSTGTAVWADVDGDDYGGDPVGSFCEPPPFTTPVDGDCDDEDPAVNPLGEETCNDLDDDCDGLFDDSDPDVDLGTAFNWFTDFDLDGYGQVFAGRACAAPPNGTTISGDCNDIDPAIHPAATEMCNSGVDDDCDLVADDADPSLDASSATVWFSDGDDDGYGVVFVDLSCTAPVGSAGEPGDCNDADEGIHPGAVELCNGKLDDDCDGLADDADPGLDLLSATIWYVDGDDDGYGGDIADLSCIAPVNAIEDGTDCDDADDAIHPGATEVCNDDVDDDCNGLVDDSDPNLNLATRTAWYRDLDADGYGGVALVATACTAPVNTADNNDDCNDGNAAISPGDVEICNSNTDDDCDGLLDMLDPSIDLLTATTSWDDDDRDGFGNPNAIHVLCSLPLGASLNDDDCDDSDRDVNPDATEICNANADDDCDGLADDADASTDLSTGIDWFTDLDNDNFGDPLAPDASCVLPGIGSLNDDDCDDSDASISPADPEACEGFDNDCDALIDDADPGVSVALRDWFPDADGDLLGDATGLVEACLAPLGFVADDTDCDDLDAFVLGPFPWAKDLDVDGFGNPIGIACTAPLVGWVPVSATLDCDDSDPEVSPVGVEVCNGGVDDDCDGLEDDADPSVDLTDGITFWRDVDEDRFGDIDGATGLVCALSAGIAGNPDDCDDGDAGVNPDAVEICNGGVDDNCDGLADDDDPSVIGMRDWFEDADSDGLGNDAVSVLACAAPVGFVSGSTDCDDTDAAVGAPSFWGVDADADGFGFAPVVACEGGLGAVALVSTDVDCDDSDPLTNPDGVDVCGDGLDQDCSGADKSCVAALIGRFRITDGPSWTGDPDTFTCLEACAEVFGGLSTDYACSTDGAAVDNQSFVDGWGDDTFCTSPKPETFKKNTHYDCGAVGCSYSAYVTDHGCTTFNYCFLL